MGPMLLGVRSSLVLALVSFPTLTGCALVDLLDGGSTLEDSFEYLPASTFKVRFIEQAAVVEGDEILSTQLDPFAEALRDAPLNASDVRWEAYAAWGDDPEEPAEAFVWKVEDDLDFEDLADDLEDKGYERAGDSAIYEADPAKIDRKDTIGGVYPAVMASVLLDEAERLVVASYGQGPLEEVAEVIADDADSLADDGGMEDLVDAVEGDPEVAWLTSAGPSICDDGPFPDSAGYHDLGRPSARALFVSGDDAPAVLALVYDSEEAAEEELTARRVLIERGVGRGGRPFSELGDFDVSQDGRLVVIEEDFDGGPRVALEAEEVGDGPGVCEKG